MRELTADEKRSYDALQDAIFHAQMFVLRLHQVKSVDAPDTKCTVPEDIIDPLNDYIRELKNTQERILDRAETYDITNARLDAEHYEQDYERGCDA